MEKYIEKNTVQETLVIPLFARAKCTELYPQLYRDEGAAQLLQTLSYDFSAMEKSAGKAMQRFGYLEVAMRQRSCL